MKGRLTLRSGTACLLLPLGGCMNMSGLGGDSKYACKAPEGVACDSVSGTYANAIHNNLPSQRRASNAARIEAQPSPPASDKAEAPFRRPTAAAPASTLAAAPAVASPGAVAADTSGQRPLALRSQARVLRLWTKPWEDADGDLYDQGYVYVQVDNGQWQIEHVQREIRTRYAPVRPPVATAANQASPDATAEADTSGRSAPLQRPLPSGAPFPSLTSPPGSTGRPQ